MPTYGVRLGSGTNFVTMAYSFVLGLSDENQTLCWGDDGAAGGFYCAGGGIHWVHTNCGQKPNPAKPNGWVKKFDAAGQLSENLEGSQEYCDLWPQRRR